MGIIKHISNNAHDEQLITLKSCFSLAVLQLIFIFIQNVQLFHGLWNIFSRFIYNTQGVSERKKPQKLHNRIS
jgi:hypothetical protein